MSLEFLTMAVLLFVVASMIGAAMAFSLSRLPAPRMRTHRHLPPAHR